MLDFKLREATKDDIAYLDKLNTECMKGYVESVMEWDFKLFTKTYNPKLVRVVLVDSKIIGMIKVQLKQDHLYLGDVMISQEFQSRGIGTSLIKLVMSEAKSANLPLRLKVLKCNPAKLLYKRLGFKVMEEIDMYYKMEKIV